MSDEPEADGGATDLWRPCALGDVIAERELTFESDRATSSVFLRLGRPMRYGLLMCLVVMVGCGESHDSQPPEVGEDPLAEASSGVGQESSLDPRSLGMRAGSGGAEIAFRVDDGQEHKLSASLRLDVIEGQETAVLAAYANDGSRSVFFRLLVPVGATLRAQRFALGFPGLDNSSVVLLVGPQLDPSEINLSTSGEVDIERLVDGSATIRFAAELERQQGPSRSITGAITGEVALVCSLIDRRQDAGGYLFGEGQGSASYVSDDSRAHPLCQQAAAMLALE